jgi:hypothetical protein
LSVVRSSSRALAKPAHLPKTVCVDAAWTQFVSNKGPYHRVATVRCPSDNVHFGSKYKIDLGLEDVVNVRFYQYVPHSFASRAQSPSHSLRRDLVIPALATTPSILPTLAPRTVVAPFHRPPRALPHRSLHLPRYPELYLGVAVWSSAGLASPTICSSFAQATIFGKKMQNSMILSLRIDDFPFNVLS